MTSRRSAAVVGFDGLSEAESRRLAHIGSGTRTLAFWAKVIVLQAERLREQLPRTEDAYLDLEHDEDEHGMSAWDVWNTTVRADAHLLVIAV